MYTNVLVFLGSIVLANAGCPDGFMSYTDNCYAFLPVKASWAEAKTYCEAIGAGLAVIESRQESDFIHGLVQREHNAISTSQIWIGGTDLIEEGVWLAPDNRQKLTFFDWAPKEPDNLNGQHCLAIFNYGSLLWDDNRCEVHNYALCKMGGDSSVGIIG
ncbi:hypothetical protein ACF0H5_016778 [Mactra antiquata]